MKRIPKMVLAITLTWLGAGGEPALADPCAGPGDRAAVCTVQAVGAVGGGRPQPIDINSPILVPVGEVLNLELEAFDQFRRPFPADRLVYGYEVERCSDSLSVEQRQVGRFQIEAGARRGDCRLWIWIPGDLNFEWAMVIRIEGRDRTGYDRSEAEFLAGRLYRALLDREADPGGLAETVASIQRGDLSQRILSIVQSPEFDNKTKGRDPNAILERLYRGLFDREPDRSGTAAFLGELRAGRLVPVVLELVNSEEFETKLIARD